MNPLLPDVCANSFYCEKCALLPFCALLSKTEAISPKSENEPILVPSVSTNNVIAQVSANIASSSVQYFQKWVRFSSQHEV